MFKTLKKRAKTILLFIVYIYIIKSNKTLFDYNKFFLTILSLIPTITV